MKWFYPVAVTIALLGGCGDKQAAAPIAMKVAAGCEATKNRCVAEANGYLLSLDLTPGIEPLKPFKVRVKAEGDSAPSSITVDFSMPSMDMGENRYRLLPDPQAVWQTEAMLPICTMGRTDWVATAEMLVGGARYQARFPFAIDR